MRVLVVAFLVAVAVSSAYGSDEINAAIEKCKKPDKRPPCPEGTGISKNPHCKEAEPVQTCEDIRNHHGKFFEGSWRRGSEYRSDYLKCLCNACGGTPKRVKGDKTRLTCKFDTESGTNTDNDDDDDNDDTDIKLKCIPSDVDLPKLKNGKQDFTYAHQNEVIGTEETKSKKKVQILYGDVLCAPADALVSSAKRKVLDSVDKERVSGLAELFYALTGYDNEYKESFEKFAKEKGGGNPEFEALDVLASPPGALADRSDVSSIENPETNPIPVKEVVTVQGPRKIKGEENGNDCGKHYPVGRIYKIVWNALKKASENKDVKSVALPVFGTNRKGCSECAAMGYSIMAAGDFLEHANTHLDTVQITLYRPPNKAGYDQGTKDFFKGFLKDAVSRGTFKCEDIDDQNDLSVLEVKDFRKAQNVLGAQQPQGNGGGNGGGNPEGVELLQGNKQCDPSERVAKEWMEALDDFTDKLVALSDKAYAGQKLEGAEVDSLKEALEKLKKTSPDADNNPQAVEDAWTLALSKMHAELQSATGDLKHEHIQSIAGHFMSVVSSQLGVAEANDL